MLKPCPCEPLGTTEGLVEVSKNCRARHSASDNIYLFNKTIVKALNCVKYF